MCDVVHTVYEPNESDGLTVSIWFDGLTVPLRSDVADGFANGYADDGDGFAHPVNAYTDVAYGNYNAYAKGDTDILF